MRRVMVRYTVKPGRAEENEQLVKAVYEELAEAKPAGFRYATFRLGDGLTFVHMAFMNHAEAGNPLESVKAFQKFQEGIGERCDVAPQVAELTDVASYGFAS